MISEKNLKFQEFHILNFGPEKTQMFDDHDHIWLLLWVMEL